MVERKMKLTFKYSSSDGDEVELTRVIPVYEYDDELTLMNEFYRDFLVGCTYNWVSDKEVELLSNDEIHIIDCYRSKPDE